MPESRPEDALGTLVKLQNCANCTKYLTQTELTELTELTVITLITENLKKYELVSDKKVSLSEKKVLYRLPRWTNMIIWNSKPKLWLICQTKLYLSTSNSLLLFSCHMLMLLYSI